MRKNILVCNLDTFELKKTDLNINKHSNEQLLNEKKYFGMQFRYIWTEKNRFEYK